MRFDFRALINNLGVTSAKIENDKTKIDSKSELNTYVSGWDAIKAQAEAQNKIAKNDTETVNINELETEMKTELASLMGAEFGKSSGVENKGTVEKPFFSEEDISLENMMSALKKEDGLDIKKLRKHNMKSVHTLKQAKQVFNGMSEMKDFGFDDDLVEILMYKTPKAVKYISDAIKTGRAKSISDNVSKADEKFQELSAAGIDKELENIAERNRRNRA